MQAFGRVHRSNQSSAPVIRLALLGLAGQKRLVNAVSKRLAALGALTKGERHSLSSELFRSEEVTDEYGKAALVRLYRQVSLGQHTEVGLGHSVFSTEWVCSIRRRPPSEKTTPPTWSSF